MNVRLVVSHVLLERTTSSIADRQARKSRNPCSNCNESRFPNPVPYFGHFLNPKNALPHRKLW